MGQFSIRSVAAVSVLVAAGWLLHDVARGQQNNPAPADKKAAAPPPKELGIGDAAPKLAVKEYVKGKAVNAFESGKIYVVDLWATWCPPCRESIPHLTELQKKYPDVTIIGVSVADDPDKVKPFVEKMGDKMNYRVAIDGKDATANSWLKAAGLNAIPTAFVVDGAGKVAWIGDPREMAGPLEKIIAGKWDLKVAVAEFAESRKNTGRPAVRAPAAELAAARAVDALGGSLEQEEEGASITSVTLSGTKATDATLKELASLKKLKVLSLVGCKGVSDAGLKEIKELKGLQTLFLGGTSVTDAGLKEIEGLKELRELGLGRTQVTDAGLKELKGLNNLQRLFLFQTKVTNVGLKELAGLKELRQLYLGNTKVTDDGVADLEKALPDVSVER